jgi:hypothetical protein
MAKALVDSGMPITAQAELPPASSPSVARQVGPPQIAAPQVDVHVSVTTSSIQIASAKVDGSLATSNGSNLAAPIVVHQAAPAVRVQSVDMSTIAHHTVDVFSPAVAQRVRGSYTLVMDDHLLKLNQPLQDRGNVLCAPLRQIFENEGGVIDWVGKTKEVRAVTSTRDIRLKIGSRTAQVNGEATSLKTAPYIFQNRTMIPVGFLPLALDVTVNYDPVTGHLLINSKS